MQEKDIAVIILAAGKGTRMQSQLPKILHQIGGKTLIDHVIDMSISLRPSKIVTVLSKGMDEIQQKIHDVSEVTVQEQQIGTGDAVKIALNNLKGFKGDIAILYADTPLISKHTVHDMLEELDTDTSIAMLGFRSSNPDNEYGRIVLDQNDEVKRIVEYKDATEAEREITLCNSGVMVCKSGLINALIDDIDNDNKKGEYYLTDIIGIANEKGYKCSCLETSEEEVIGVNNRFELARAENIYQQRLRKSMMLQGVTLIAPETVFLSYDIKVGRDIVIHPHVVFGPNVILEDNVEIMPFTHVEGAHIASNATVGPFARVRPGTEIGKHAKVGNFVELKQTEIGEYSKVNHLSYIGDATVGTRSNIGAGTITCNYDGYDKHRTSIGNNVFIGSNTSLIAPIRIGNGAIVGAGSTLHKDVERDNLVLSERKVLTKEGGGSSYRERKNKTGNTS